MVRERDCIAEKTEKFGDRSAYILSDYYVVVFSFLINADFSENRNFGKTLKLVLIRENGEDKAFYEYYYGRYKKADY